MKIHAYGATTKGRIREHNEDAFLVDENSAMFMVADGMGGHAAGEVASRIAVETISSFILDIENEATWPFEQNSKLSYEANKLIQAIRMANRRVLEETRKNDLYKGMGTTILAMLVRPDSNENDTVYIGHVGDSRAYRVRAGRIEQITRDHSWISKQVEDGVITPDIARRHPLRNVITRALGSDDAVAVDIIEQKLEEGDIYLLCTDGLSTMIEDGEIGQIIESADGDLKLATERLIERANDHGGEDNATVILVSSEKSR